MGNHILCCTHNCKELRNAIFFQLKLPQNVIIGLQHSYIYQLRFSLKKCPEVNVFLAALDSDVEKYLDHLPCLCFVRSSQGYLNRLTMKSVQRGQLNLH